MEAGIFIQGRGLASALGSSMGAALAALAAGGIAPGRLTAAPGAELPYFAIPDETPDWSERACRLVASVVAECGPVDREAPLFLASSSLNVGNLEAGGPFLPDCQAFVEEVAGWLDWRGPVFWVSTACTSSLVALLSARRMIQAGAAGNALVLGLELGNRFSSAGFGAMQLLDPVAPRPLARDRGGLVLGEAVAALYLGTTPARWQLLGGANRVDGSNPAGAQAETVARVVVEALADSGIGREAIDLVKLQAAGSPHNDRAEIEGLGQVFAAWPALMSLKDCLGHTLGAAGAAEIALLTACLEAGRWPRQADQEPDPALGVACSAALPPKVRRILANILGFGGGHACVVLEDGQ